jgi:hypothetical protein
MSFRLLVVGVRLERGIISGCTNINPFMTLASYGGRMFDLLLPWLASNIFGKLHVIMPPTNDSNDDTMA